MRYEPVLCRSGIERCSPGGIFVSGVAMSEGLGGVRAWDILDQSFDDGRTSNVGPHVEFVPMKRSVIGRPFLDLNGQFTIGDLEEVIRIARQASIQNS